MVYSIGYSLQGKDKGTIYLLEKVNEKYYRAYDGERFPFDKPKKKNKKHLQIIKKYSVYEILQISKDDDISNEKIQILLNIISKDIQEVK